MSFLTCRHTRRYRRTNADEFLRQECGAEILQHQEAKTSPPPALPHQDCVQHRQQVASATPAGTQTSWKTSRQRVKLTDGIHHKTNVEKMWIYFSSQLMTNFRINHTFPFNFIEGFQWNLFALCSPTLKYQLFTLMDWMSKYKHCVFFKWNLPFLSQCATRDISNLASNQVLPNTWKHLESTRRAALTFHLTFVFDGVEANRLAVSPQQFAALRPRVQGEEWTFRWVPLRHLTQQEHHHPLHQWLHLSQSFPLCVKVTVCKTTTVTDRHKSRACQSQSVDFSHFPKKMNVKLIEDWLKLTIKSFKVV